MGGNGGGHGGHGGTQGAGQQQVLKRQQQSLQQPQKFLKQQHINILLFYVLSHFIKISIQM